MQKLNSNFQQLLDFKLTLKHALSKPTPRVIVLIMVCQHIQNEVLIHLVSKVLEPNSLLCQGNNLFQFQKILVYHFEITNTYIYIYIYIYILDQNPYLI